MTRRANEVGEVKAAMRDASWFAHPGRAEVFHVMVDDWRMACAFTKTRMAEVSRGLLNEDTAVTAVSIKPCLRCQRNGCKQRWPK